MGDRVDVQWYFSRGGAQQGPLAEAAVLELLARGELTARDMVWRAGMRHWVAAGSVAELTVGGGAGAGVRPPPLPSARAGYTALDGVAGYPYDYQTEWRPAVGQDAGMRWLMPVGRSGWAIAAGYVGLLSFLVFPAPIALIVSIMAIRDLKKNPTLHGLGRAWFGMVMGILGTGALALALVASMLSHRHY